MIRLHDDIFRPKVGLKYRTTAFVGVNTCRTVDLLSTMLASRWRTDSEEDDDDFTVCVRYVETIVEWY